MIIEFMITESMITKWFRREISLYYVPSLQAVIQEFIYSRMI